MPNRMLALIVSTGLGAACASVNPPAPRQSAFEAALARAASQVQRCYRLPRVAFAGRQIVTRLRVRYLADGQLGGVPVVLWQAGVTPANASDAPRMAQAAIGAVLRCTPVRFPEAFYRDGAIEFDLTFSPVAPA